MAIRSGDGRDTPPFYARGRWEDPDLARRGRTHVPWRLSCRRRSESPKRDGDVRSKRDEMACGQTMATARCPKQKYSTEIPESVKMANTKLSDGEGKKILLDRWPERTQTIWPPPGGYGFWLRAQPTAGGVAGPRLSAPGATLFTTQPDGLWMHCSKSVSCDVVAVEICGTIQNLNDKRSRYIPASHSLVLTCSNGWLLEEIAVRGGGKRPRWKALGTLEIEPTMDLVLPVRHLRVLYALPNALYKTWCPHHTPTGYEFFCPHSSLQSRTAQKMRSFLSQMSVAAQFYQKL
jgi:hypothetical protein